MRSTTGLLGDRLPAMRSVAGLFVLLAAWWLLSSSSSVEYAPNPAVIGRAWVDLLNEGVLLRGLIATSRSFLLSWIIAGAIGLGVGLLMALSRPVRDALTPVIEILRPIPS